MADPDDNHPVRPFHDQLGSMPDGDLAKLAGTTMWVVRGYRLRAGIPAYDRWAAAKGKSPSAPRAAKASKTAAKKAKAPKAAKSAAPERAAAPAPAPVRLAPAPAPAPAPAHAPAPVVAQAAYVAPATGVQWAWRVVDAQGSDRVVIGSSISDVARTVDAARLDVARIERIAKML